MGMFYLKSKPFLHFHDVSAGIFVDVKLDLTTYSSGRYDHKGSERLLGVHVIGELASELVHIGLACLSFSGDIDFFIHTVFNYPTLGDVYKYAAYSALGKLNKAREAGAKT